MPDNSKVIYTDPNAPSGAADALSAMFQNNREMENYAQKKDIDTNAAVKLKKQENDFATGLEVLHQQFRLDQMDKQNQIAQQNLIQAGTAVAGQVQKTALAESQRTGELIPGLTSQAPAPAPTGSLNLTNPTAETGIGPSGDMGYRPGPITANQIDPRAAQQAASQLHSVMSENFRKDEEKTKQSRWVQQTEMSKALGMATPDMQKAAADMANNLRSIDPTNPSIPVLEAHSKDGVSSASWEKVVPAIAEKYNMQKASLEKMSAQENLRFARMQQHDQNAAAAKIQIEKLKAAGPAEAGKILTNLKKQHDSMKSNLDTIQREQQLANQKVQAGAFSSQKEQDEAMTVAKRLDDSVHKIQQDMQQIEQSMNEYNNRVVKTTPGPADLADAKQKKEQLGLKVLKDMGITDGKLPENRRSEFAERIQKELGGK